jgi:hypothetical protein
VKTKKKKAPLSKKTTKKQPRRKTMSITEYNGKKLYKVVGPRGEAISSGRLDWALPKGDEPGAWMHVDGALRMCAWGLHLTTDPTQWTANECRIFEVEAQDPLLSGSSVDYSEEGAKIVVRSARLVRELTEAECVEFGIFRSGEHEVKSGRAFASGSANGHARPARPTVHRVRLGQRSPRTARPRSARPARPRSARTTRPT